MPRLEARCIVCDGPTTQRIVYVTDDVERVIHTCERHGDVPVHYREQPAAIVPAAPPTPSEGL